MQVAILLVIAAIFGVVFRGVFTHSNNNNVKKQPTVVPTNSPTLTPTIAITNTSTPIHVNTMQQNPTQSPAIGISINDFIYPGSTFVRNDGQALVYNSGDTTINITNWYKQKIAGLHMNVQSMVETNANGNIQNSFVAANAFSKVSVTITKHSSDQSTEIKISLN